jgi:hypothetical protein
MNKVLTCTVLALLQAGSALAAESEDLLTLTVGNTAYSISRDFLGQVVPHPERPQGILTRHVHYPDLAPVGNTSGKCPRKVALTDEKCPYFSIFIVPDDEHLPANYEGLIKGLSLKSKGVEAGYEVFPFSGGNVYKWVENRAVRTFDCTDLTCQSGQDRAWWRVSHCFFELLVARRQGAIRGVRGIGG